MKSAAKISSLLILFTLTSCYNAEVISDIPKIDILDLRFFDVPSDVGSDSLVITFSFQDGSGDIGLDPDDDFFFPFNEFLVFLDSDNTLITTENLNTIVPPIYVAELITNNITFEYRNGDLFYSVSGSSHAIPAFNKQLYNGNIEDIELECPNLYNQNGAQYGTIPLTLYDIENENLTRQEFTLNETIIVQKVETHKNAIVEFFEQINGEYVLIDFSEKFGIEECDALGASARLPIFDPNGKAGTIKYKSVSARYKGAFLNNQIMMKLFVYDRMLNKSNVDSIEFFLSDITQ